MYIVVNHLHLREPAPDGLVGAAQQALQAVVDAGGIAAQLARADETHLVLVLTFATAQDAERIARDVGGPWMREHIAPLLAGDTDRTVAEVVASAQA